MRARRGDKYSRRVRVLVGERMRQVRSYGLCRSWKGAVNLAASVSHRYVTGKGPMLNSLRCKGVGDIIYSPGPGNRRTLEHHFPKGS